MDKRRILSCWLELTLIACLNFDLLVNYRVTNDPIFFIFFHSLISSKSHSLLQRSFIIFEFSPNVSIRTLFFQFALGILVIGCGTAYLRGIPCGTLCTGSILRNILGYYLNYRCGVVVISTAQLHSTKPELRFCAGSNLARGVLEICDGQNLWQWSRLEIRLIAFCWSTIPQKQFIIIINSKLVNVKWRNLYVIISAKLKANILSTVKCKDLFHWF